MIHNTCVRACVDRAIRFRYVRKHLHDEAARTCQVFSRGAVKQTTGLATERENRRGGEVESRRDGAERETASLTSNERSRDESAIIAAWQDGEIHQTRGGGCENKRPTRLDHWVLQRGQ